MATPPTPSPPPCPVNLPYCVEIVNDIQELRNFIIPTPNPFPYFLDHYFVYVQCHTTFRDGGGGFFYYTNYLGFAPYPDDNNGTCIEPIQDPYSDGQSIGRWIRVIDGNINIRFFGYPVSGNDYTVAIKSAIEHASGFHQLLIGNTVYFPNGIYGVSETIILKTGVSLIGESSNTTIWRALYDDKIGPQEYMLEMEKGRIQGCNIANIAFEGNNIKRGCMRFRAEFGIYGDGGMWSCTFKNILINFFNGNGMVFEAGSIDNYKLPNQFLVFENMQVNRQRDEDTCLIMTGEHGQITFINCGFGGKLIKKDDKLYELKGTNVLLAGAGTIGLQPDVVSFINGTFQDSEYGIVIENSESITIDTCWFENLDLGVTVKNNEHGSSKGINILNSRFANAAGFGSLDIVNRNTIPGRCITSIKSEINVYNNYVTVSSLSIDQPNPPFGKNFILALEDNLGVRTTGNSFQDSRLGYSYGIMQYVPKIENDPLYDNIIRPGKYINLKDNKLVFIKLDDQKENYPIDRIQCSISAGETLSIRADQQTIEFTSDFNIFFSNQSGLTLDNGDIATFIKIDNYITKTFTDGISSVTYEFPETYQLISVIKSTSPL